MIHLIDAFFLYEVEYRQTGKLAAGYLLIKTLILQAVHKKVIVAVYGEESH
jgi:hypothetical protein